MDALDRAIKAILLEDLEISNSDVRSFFIRYLHTIGHWASTHLVCGGLYMPLQAYLWVLPLGSPSK